MLLVCENSNIDCPIESVWDAPMIFIQMILSKPLLTMTKGLVDELVSSEETLSVFIGISKLKYLKKNTCDTNCKTELHTFRVHLLDHVIKILKMFGPYM